MGADRTGAINTHAGCVLLGRRGILILGPSGAGKSDLALRLIDEGAKLVADDRTDLWVKDGRLVARPPPSIAGLIEVRGVGIVALPYAPSAMVAMAVKLGTEHDRLPHPEFYRPPHALRGAKPVPLLTLDGRAASAPAKIRLGLAAFSKSLFRDTFNPPMGARK